MVGFERVERIGGAAVISLLGTALLVPTVARLVTGGSPVELLLAGVGALVSTVVVAAGYLLVRMDLRPAHVLRVAGWAVLGTVVLGGVLALIVASGVALPLYTGATLLSVSTFAHVLIGARDVQRIRANELARQREKLSVLNRLVRHNLRHFAQRLVFVESRIRDAADADERAVVADDVEDVADEISGMDDVLNRTATLVSRASEGAGAADLAVAVEDVAATYRERHPEATIEVDVPDVRVAGGDNLRRAIAELVENAIVHGDATPDVRVTATTEGDRVVLRIDDDGPGIPEPDRSVLAREAEITQLSHSRGLGLWFVRWVLDAYGDGFELDTGDGGTTVVLRLRRA